MLTEIKTIQEVIEPANITFSQDEKFTNPNGYLWVQARPKHIRYIFSGNLYFLKDRMCSRDHLGDLIQYIPQFSLYPHKTNVTDSKIVNVFEVIEMMKGDELKEKAAQIKQARDAGDEAKRTKLKDQLPYITHTGIFIPRNNASLKLPGFTYQLDIDGIANADEILEKIINDKQLEVLFASKSVSGNGVKALLFFKELLFLRDVWNYQQYVIAYKKVHEILQYHFKDQYRVKIDNQMKAISQPFFLFHSTDLYINKNLRQWVQ